MVLLIIAGVAGLAVPIWMVQRGTALKIPETWNYATGVRGEPYTATMQANGGVPPISWSISRRRVTQRSHPGGGQRPHPRHADPGRILCVCGEGIG